MLWEKWSPETLELSEQLNVAQKLQIDLGIRVKQSSLLMFKIARVMWWKSDAPWLSVGAERARP